MQRTRETRGLSKRWALIEEDENGELYTNVVGMDAQGHIAFSDDGSNFVGYTKE